MVDIDFPRSMPLSLASDRYQHCSLPPLSWAGHSATRTRDHIFGGAGQSCLDQGSHIVPASTRHGLRTPPGDMTGVSVNPLLAPNYEDFQYKSVPAVKSTTAPRQSSVGTIPNVRYTGRSQPSHDAYHSRNSSSEINRVTDISVPKHQSSRHQNGIEAADIVSYLQIPSSINESKGSLAEFAAQITCLFWFESSFTLHFVEESKLMPTPIQPLVHEAMPTMGFRKWVVSILSTTQVSQNVILLALMFIYRLKRLNPGVKGKLGSEFRLFTVALMLGNKFLDDNTYTNKTWAEVSGISVQEIHIMEVEFLSNMRYTLYASEAEWKAWHVKLGKFWKYFENASRTPIESPPRAFGLPLVSTNSAPNLPSPPASTHTSPPYAPSHTFTTTPLHPHPLSMPPYLPPAAPSPLGPLPGIDSRSATRKRSHDYGHESLEPPAKRLASSIAPSVSSSTTLTPSTLADFTPGTTLTTPSFGPGSSSSAPRLPMPNLSVSTGNQHNTYPASSSAQLPYSGTNPRPTMLPSVSRVTQSGMLPSLHQTVNSNHSGSHDIPPMSDWPARQSPFAAGSATPSPTTFNFPSSAQTPQHLSPAGFMIPRNSPYKPVRSVNTLLVPPPSASMHNPPEQVSYDQMHYLPLGKPASQSRPGVLPSMQHDNLGQPHDMPLYLPQPRFSR